MTERWGVGNRVNEEAFGTARIGDREAELIFGEHPHSRQDNNIYARIGDRVIGFSGHRICVSIEIKEHNYIKDSELSGDDIRKACSLSISFNGRRVFGGDYRDHLAALRYAPIQIDKLMEHPLDVWQDDWGERAIGRKVYYHETPALIGRVLPEQNCVVVEALPGSEFPRPSWMDEHMEHDPHRVKDDIFSPHFNWFRD